MMETFVAGIMFVWAMALTAQSCEAQGPQIRITPETNDLTLFEGKEFRRLCEVDGVSGDVNVMFVWERNGLQIDSVEGTDQLQLYISEVEQAHAGTYTCRVVLTPQTSGAIMNLGPASAGTLTVLGRDLINAPRYQVITEGTSGSLNCSYPGGHVTWERQGNTVSTIFTSATFADEGLYVCDIYVPSAEASDKVPVMLYVVVPIQILETSRPVHQNLTRNEAVTFAVDFRGRQSHDLTITWHHAGVALSTDDSRIYNTFNTDLGTGRSEFRLPLASRTDAGLYRVLISSVVGGDQDPPTFSSQDEATFQVDIAVRPVVPVGLLVDQLSSRTAQVTWTLNNDTPDQSADELILRVTFANRSLADLLTLPGDLTTMTLEDLIPAHEYSVVLTAVNSDGEVTTNPISFSTLEGSPAIAAVNVQRVNRTHFVLAIQVAYTGGGSITTVDVSYRVGNTGPMTFLMDVEPEHVSQLLVELSVALTDASQQQAVEHEAGMELEFTVVVHNQFNFQSEPKSNEVAAHFPPTSVTTSTGPGATAIQMETPLLPLWLIAVIASVVTILIMLFLVACVVAVCIHCRKASSKKFSPEVQPESSPNVAAENGRLPSTQSSDSLPTHIEQFRARSESSSQPSEVYTPSLEEYKKHKREHSECSSIGMTKAMITPSTTASNSPANFSKSHFINSQDKSLECINELELTSRGSDDSGTESERDRIRHHQQRIQQQKAMMSASPCSHNNMINYQYHDAEYLRGHADGSICGSSHHSLTSNGNPYMHSYPQLNFPQSKHFSRRRVGTEYMYSDCESVASTDVSCSNASLSSSWQQQKHHRAGLYRSPTPYNHEYTSVTEESVV